MTGLARRLAYLWAHLCGWLWLYGGACRRQAEQCRVPVAAPVLPATPVPEPPEPPEPSRYACAVVEVQDTAEAHVERAGWLASRSEPWVRHMAVGHCTTAAWLRAARVEAGRLAS